MGVNRYHHHELIINYLFMKVNSRIPNLHIDDLREFLDEKGWEIYDMSIMIRDINIWQKERNAVLV